MMKKFKVILLAIFVLSLVQVGCSKKKSNNRRVQTRPTTPTVPPGGFPPGGFPQGAPNGQLPINDKRQSETNVRYDSSNPDHVDHPHIKPILTGKSIGDGLYFTDAGDDELMELLQKTLKERTPGPDDELLVEVSAESTLNAADKELLKKQNLALDQKTINAYDLDLANKITSAKLNLEDSEHKLELVISGVGNLTFVKSDLLSDNNDDDTTDDEVDSDRSFDMIESKYAELEQEEQLARLKKSPMSVQMSCVASGLDPCRTAVAKITKKIPNAVSYIIFRTYAGQISLDLSSKDLILDGLKEGDRVISNWDRLLSALHLSRADISTNDDSIQSKSFAVVNGASRTEFILRRSSLDTLRYTSDLYIQGKNPAAKIENRMSVSRSSSDSYSIGSIGETVENCYFMNNNGRGMFRVNCDLRPDPNVTARKRQENEFKNSPLYRTHFDWDPRYSDLQTRGDRNGNRRKAVRERSLEMTFLPIKPPTNIHDLKFPKPKVRP